MYKGAKAKRPAEEIGLGRNVVIHYWITKGRSIRKRTAYTTQRQAKKEYDRLVKKGGHRLAHLWRDGDIVESWGDEALRDQWFAENPGDEAPYGKRRAANAAWRRGRQARRDGLGVKANLETKYRSAWESGWDTENNRILRERNPAEELDAEFIEGLSLSEAKRTKPFKEFLGQKDTSPAYVPGLDLHEKAGLTVTLDIHDWGEPGQVFVSRSVSAPKALESEIAAMIFDRPHPQPRDYDLAKSGEMSSLLTRSTRHGGWQLTRFIVRPGSDGRDEALPVGHSELDDLTHLYSTDKGPDGDEHLRQIIFRDGTVMVRKGAKELAYNPGKPRRKKKPMKVQRRSRKGNPPAGSGMFDFGDGNGPVAAAQHINPNGSVGGWVAFTAHVDDTATVFKKALVYGNATVHFEAKVFGESRVFDRATVGDRAMINGAAEVYDRAKVLGDANVHGKAKIYGDAIIKDAKIGGAARVYEGAQVRGATEVSGAARIYGRAWVQGHSVKVEGQTQITGRAQVLDGASILGHAIVTGSAEVRGDAQIGGRANVFGDALISENAKVGGEAHVGGDARVVGDADVFGDAVLRSGVYTTGKIYEGMGEAPELELAAPVDLPIDEGGEITGEQAVGEWIQRGLGGQEPSLEVQRFVGGEQPDVFGGMRKHMQSEVQKDWNPTKRKKMAAQQLIDRCRKLWESYDRKPLKRSLVALTNHLERMKDSKSVRVKAERSRCLRMVNKEWKLQGWAKPKPAPKKKVAKKKAKRKAPTKRRRKNPDSKYETKKEYAGVGGNWELVRGGGHDATYSLGDYRLYMWTDDGLGWVPLKRPAHGWMLETKGSDSTAGQNLQNVKRHGQSPKDTFFWINFNQAQKAGYYEYPQWNTQIRLDEVAADAVKSANEFLRGLKKNPKPRKTVTRNPKGMRSFLRKNPDCEEFWILDVGDNVPEYYHSADAAMADYSRHVLDIGGPGPVDGVDPGTKYTVQFFQPSKSRPGKMGYSLQRMWDPKEGDPAWDLWGGGHFKGPRAGNPKPRRKNARKKKVSKKEAAKWEQMGRGWEYGSMGYDTTTGRVTSVTYVPPPSSGSVLTLNIELLYDEAELIDGSGDGVITVEKYTRVAGEDDEAFAKRVMVKARATNDMYLGPE